MTDDPTAAPPTASSAVAADDATELGGPVVALGALALRFGLVDRITYHEDGETPESDTDHTVMLGLVACAYAAARDPGLDVGRVAVYALVHDLVEVYAGDTPTLVIDDDERDAKHRREAAALERIRDEFTELPWVAETIDAYESGADPEARYVRAADKVMPRITHILNRGATLRSHGISPQQAFDGWQRQHEDIRAYAGDLRAVLDLHFDLSATASGLAGGRPPPVRTEPAGPCAPTPTSAFDASDDDGQDEA